MIYMRTGDGNDVLAWMNRDGNSVTESQFAILRAAACKPDTEALPPLREHHQLVQKGAELMLSEERSIGGGLGRPSGARFRTYERLKRYADDVSGELFDTPELKRAIDEIYRFPLRQAATDALNRQLRSGITDRMLAELVITLRDEDRLCIVEGEKRNARTPDYLFIGARRNSKTPMTINYHRIREYLETSEFGPLLINELGWDYHTQRLNVVVDETEYLLTAVAEKRGLVVFCNSAPTEDDIPDYATRRKIERQVAKSVREHLIIYTDDEKSTQIWQWVKRAVAKPDACREHRYWVDQPANSLIEKLAQIKVSLDDEEAGFTLVDQLGNVQSAFDVERVTKKFYVRFKVEHEVFLKFLREMPDEAMQRWYASIILNRLMFIYFIQKKGFLNDDRDYLRTKLRQSQTLARDRYYTDFLCRYSLKGLQNRSPIETRGQGGCSEQCRT